MLNKVDALDDEERAFFKAELETIAGGPVFLMSGVSREGVDAVLRVLRHEIDAGRKQETRVEQEDLEWRP